MAGLVMDDVDRLKLCRDLAYFCREARRRIEALEDTEPVGRVRSNWQQAAALVGSVKRFTGEQALAEQRRRDAEARADRTRGSLQ
jgi:hypothetical protein